MNKQIPDSWKVKNLQQVAKIQTGLAKGKKGIKNPVKLPYLRVANVQDGYLDLTEIKEIEVDQKNIDRYQLQMNDILLTEGGDFDKLGRGHLWKNEIPVCLHQNHIFVVRVNRDVLDPYFFSSLTGSEYGKKYFLSCAKQTTNLASINSTQLKNFPAIIPPLPEQRRIAEILGTWDEAITLTGRLIEAKQHRKKALMQQLLTGKTRFREFVGEWRKVRLGDVFQRVTRKFEGEPEHVLSITAGIGFVDQREKFSRVIAGKSLKNYIRLKRGEFSYNKGNSKTYPQGCVYLLEQLDEAAVPNVYYSFRAKSREVVNEFYKFYFENGLLNRHLIPFINAGVRNDGLLNLAPSDFFKVEILFLPVEEQRRIAAVLQACDEEIELLGQKLAALRRQKQGLMQQLLTGKVRVGQTDEG